MSKLIAICYVSSAIVQYTPEKLDALLLDARAFNREIGVTGALLHHDGCFFQYLEGEAAAVEQVYQRIRHSKLHHNIIELLKQPIEQRNFAEWHMGYADITQSELQKLSQAEWKKSMEGAVPPQNLGIKLLLSFWHRSRYE